ncbi:hypothetical protein HLB44_05605 [Aquincola sp. S2]|uniref:Uncharacterized protein n=1 Tax=Pseudaquabacterium terrae TaxID=2732868 RepID=A0ABX2EDN0_9BURK|nr:hypothetical protein [Aquabacterium terrae]NRF66452.1 hypothetical protein [Aquabacterium terrae]
MSRVVWGVLLAVVGLALGLWVAARFGFVGTPPPLPGPLAELQAHLRQQGIHTEGRLVRRGPWDRVHQHARFELLGRGERAFFVLWCHSPEIAQQHLQRLRAMPSPSLPQANGELVAYFTDWPADEPLTRQVLNAFTGFAAAPARR